MGADGARSRPRGTVCGVESSRCGGAPMGKQIEALKAGAQIVAGTPGRVLDHIRRRPMKLAGVKMLVLDECDEMLSMGFQEEIEAILKELPTDRQTLLLSATIPEAVCPPNKTTSPRAAS